MFIKVPKSGKYRGIGLKTFNDLTDWYYQHIDVDFSNSFAFAKSVAKAPPVFSKSTIPAAPTYTSVAKSSSITMTRTNTPKPIYIRV